MPVSKKKPAKKSAKKSAKKPAKRKGQRKYGKGAQAEVKREMRSYKKGKARSGKGLAKVSSRKQAIAIALSEARKKGIKVPKKSRKKSK